MVDIFDEVEEDLRAERMARFARRYGIALVAFVLLVVLGVAAWQVWRWYEGRQDARAATAFIGVLDQAAQRGSAANRAPLAEKFADVAKTAPDGYATLARLNEASLLADSGQMNKAEAMWDKLMNDSAISPVLRQVATLSWASHELETAEPSLIQARLGPLSADSSPWRPIALQYLGLLSIRTGDTKGAIKTFQSVANDISTPADMRNMANAMAQALGAPPAQQ